MHWDSIGCDAPVAFPSALSLMPITALECTGILNKRILKVALIGFNDVHCSCQFYWYYFRWNLNSFTVPRRCQDKYKRIKVGIEILISHYVQEGRIEWKAKSQ